MSNNPPLVGAGAGTELSFSTIRDFYGDTNPVSLSEFNRGGSLVSSSFAGASTATTTTGSGTKNDMIITQTSSTVYTGTPQSFVKRVEQGTGLPNTQISVTYTVNAGDSVIYLAGFAFTTYGGDDQASVSGGFQYTKNNGSAYSYAGGAYQFKGPAWQTGHHPSLLSYQGNFDTDDVIVITLTSGFNASPTGNVYVSTSRVNPSSVYSTTFQNNSSVSTYTLASSSTRIGSNSQVYAPQASRAVGTNLTSNQWTIAYDNVSGSGSGNAGDLVVTVTGQTDTRTVSTGFVSGQNSICTLQVPTNIPNLTFVSATGGVSEPNNDGNSGCSLYLGNQIVATGFSQESSGSSATYTGSASPGDTFQIVGGQTGRSLSITFTTPSRRIVFRNDGSSSITIGSASTGGAKTIAAGNSTTAQAAGASGGYTNNQSWQVYFDTSSGDSNIGIPATISSGNPVNIDLFNTVTTPVG